MEVKLGEEDYNSVYRVEQEQTNLLREDGM